jgi:hypothetical protein
LEARYVPEALAHSVATSLASAHNLPPADAHLRSNKCYLNRDNAQLR